MGGVATPPVLTCPSTYLSWTTLHSYANLGTQNGWEVSGEAANAPEAIEKAQELMPDLIAHDLAMPVMNDLEAARALKRLTACAPADVHQLRRSSRSA
jgi:CheY-like chemotaxis protein